MYPNLRIVRTNFKKSQNMIAGILGITKQQYQLYESGKREMPMRHFITLADFYGVSLDYLAGRKDS